MEKLIYLDYNSTTPVFESVKQALNQHIDLVGNASSVHQLGQKVRGKIEQARFDLKKYLDIPERVYDVTFTSCATEGLNDVLFNQDWDFVLYSALEHAAIKYTLDYVTTAQKEVLPVDSLGQLRLDVLEERLELIRKTAPKAKILVAVMHVSNVIGVIQPVEQVSQITKKYGAFFLCDIVQSAGRIPMSCQNIAADYYVLSGHKFGCIKGIGALISVSNAPLKPLIYGGGQESNRRAGTENVLGAIVLPIALQEAIARIEEFEKVRVWRDEMESYIKAHAPDASILAYGGKRISNTSCIVMPGKESMIQLMSFDMKGFCLSSGSACSSGKVKKHDIADALGYPMDLNSYLLRVSGGWQNQQRDFMDFARAWVELYQ